MRSSRPPLPPQPPRPARRPPGAALSPGPHVPPGSRRTASDLRPAAATRHLPPCRFLSLQRRPRGKAPCFSLLGASMQTPQFFSSTPRAYPHPTPPAADTRTYGEDWGDCDVASRSPKQPQLLRGSLCASSCRRRRHSRTELPRRLPGNRTLRREGGAASGAVPGTCGRRSPQPGLIR